MPFRYLEGITRADVAFEARGASLEELFLSSSDATLQVMIEDPSTIRPQVKKEFSLKSDEGPGIARLEELLHDYLQKIVYFKDAEFFLFRPDRLRFGERSVHVEGHGERIDAARQALGTDVKGVTLHRFQVERFADGWRAVVVLDI